MSPGVPAQNITDHAVTFVRGHCHLSVVLCRVPDKYDRILNLVDSPIVGANFDTGNAYLGGIDPIQWLCRIKHRLVHIHAKDISIEQSDKERGKVMGTPVGCACGDGVIDWAEVVSILRGIPQDIVLSVECGTLDQAARSIEHLRKIVN